MIAEIKMTTTERTKTLIVILRTEIRITSTEDRTKTTSVNIMSIRETTMLDRTSLISESREKTPIDVKTEISRDPNLREMTTISKGRIETDVKITSNNLNMM